MIVTAIAVQRIVVTVFAMLAAAVYLVSARGSCGESVPARYGVGVLGATLAALVMLGLITPVVAYAVLCLSMVAVYVIDLMQEERARKRRVASLAPRPRVSPVLAIWTAIGALSAVMVAPYTIQEGNRIVAAIVGACAVAMAAVAWRIASAPVQLLGEDPAAERRADLASRALRTGITSVSSVGIVFVFASFVNQTSEIVTPVERAVNYLAFYAWAGLGAWVVVHRWLVRPHAGAS